jgi:tetratricopeptide (TPR) repeat protein
VNSARRLTQAARSNRAYRHEHPAWLALALVALVAAVYDPVRRFGFVNWDDYITVVNNGMVNKGLSLASTTWALKTTYGGNYIPLAWLSHMADTSIFGMEAAGRHVVSVLWHALNALLLFFFLRSATGASVRSFWLAALFAVHPLHVESVAWISERKDVLSTFFWIAGLWAYVGYVRNPSWARYLLVAGAFLLGLLSKPMLVTFPFTLLLLDHWPLNRCTPPGRNVWALVREKLPLFALVPAVAAMALFAQAAGGAVSELEVVGIGPRVANAFVSIGQYLWHLLLPLNLSAIYPHTGNSIEWRRAFVSAASVIAISVLTLTWGRARPYLAMGWLWFLGTLVPVLGFVQVGAQAWADRYTYVPYIGLFIAIVWLVADLAASRPVLQRTATVVSIAVLFAFTWLARAQALVWRDDESLFGQVVESFPNAFQGHYRLAIFYRLEKRWEQAVAESRRAVEAAPDRFDAWTNLGLALQGNGRNEEAVAALRKACELNPRSAAALFNLAQMDESQGRLDDAERGYRRAIEINPLEKQSLFRLGAMLAQRGDLAGARPFVQKLAWLEREGWTSATSPRDVGLLCIRVELWPEAQAFLEGVVRGDASDADAWSYLGLARQRQHQYASAIDAYERAVRIQPGMVGSRFNLGVALLQLGDLNGAQRVYEELRPIDEATAARLLDTIRQEQTRRRSEGSGGNR